MGREGPEGTGFSGEVEDYSPILYPNDLITTVYPTLQLYNYRDANILDAIQLILLTYTLNGYPRKSKTMPPSTSTTKQSMLCAYRVIILD